jgi:hypothetical protein
MKEKCSQMELDIVLSTVNSSGRFRPLQVHHTSSRDKAGGVAVGDSPRKLEAWDNGGRRSGIDRRKFKYADHFPERRVNQDRRLLPDRRNGFDRRTWQIEIEGVNLRSGVDRRAAFSH